MTFSRAAVWLGRATLVVRPWLFAWLGVAGVAFTFPPCPLGAATDLGTEAWTVRHQRPGGFLRAITKDGFFYRLIAVGDGGRILTSTDGITWTPQVTGVTDNLYGVMGDGTPLVAVGANGRILYGSNYNNWSVRQSPTTLDLYNVAYLNGTIYAVGEQGVVVSSTDGETWQLGSTGATGWLRGLQTVSVRGSVYLLNPSVPLSIRGEWEQGLLSSGQGGEVRLLFNGAWQAMPSGVTDDLDFLGGLDTGTLYGAVAPQEALIVGAGLPVLNYVAALSGTPTLPTTFGSIAPVTDFPAAPVRLRAAHRGLGILASPSPVITVGAQGYVGLNGVPQRTRMNLDFEGITRFYYGVIVVGEDETILESGGALPARMVNLSTRAVAGGAFGPLIGGTVITGDQPKRVLVRAVGPGLSAFNVTALMPRPTLALHDEAGTVVATNAGWMDDPAVQAAGLEVGAFPLTPGSNDAALVTTVAPGRYTCVVDAGPGTAPGIVLVELYDLDSSTPAYPRMLNLSSRGHAAEDAAVMIAGFIVAPGSPGKMLVRGVGPGLSGFNVGGLLEDPVITVFDGNGVSIAQNDDWGSEANRAFVELAAREIGAFALASGSKDAALLLQGLAPGNYTMHVAGKGGAGGTALGEIYEVP